MLIFNRDLRTALSLCQCEADKQRVLALHRLGYTPQEALKVMVSEVRAREAAVRAENDSQWSSVGVRRTGSY